MNPRYVIAGLLALNLAFAIYIMVSRPAAKPATPSPRHFQTEVKPVVKERFRTNTVVVTNRFEWAQLEAEDYKDYIARLRSIGCPEETIHDIIIADLEKLMASRIQEIDGRKEPPKYWKAEAREMIRTLDSLEKLTRKDEVDFQKREIIRELLGIDLAAQRLKQKGEADIYQDRLSFLPEEKLSRVRTVIERANREEILLREKSWLEGDDLTAEDKKRLHDIEKGKERSIAAMLTPDEKQKYDLWFSPSAYRVRDALFTLDNSEEEFLGIYAAQRAFDARWGGVEPSSLNNEEKGEYEKAREEYNADIKQVLGPERYGDFVRAQDNDYRQLAIAAAQFGLPAKLAGEVYGFKQIASEQRGQVLADKSLSEAQKVEILRDIATETERAVVELMGPKAFRYYLRSGAGKWVVEY